MSFNAGAGHSEGSDETADLTGTLLSAGICCTGSAAASRSATIPSTTATNYRSATIAGRAWWSVGDFEFALLGRQRDHSVALTLELPLRTVRREVDFSALGAGLQVSFARGDFNAYAMGLDLRVR